MSIIVLPETPSTNDVALAAVRQGAPHGSCWIADAQTQGRGRREVGGPRRAWHSPPQANLYMSVLLRPEIDPARAAPMTLAAALGACRACRAMTGLDIWIKWPNDLFIGDRKLAGILTEAHLDGPRLDAVVVGLGINVNLSVEDAPTDLQETLTSLRAASGQRWDRLALALAVREQVIDACMTVADEGLSAILDPLRERDGMPGRAVRFQRGGEWAIGQAEGIDDSGALRVRDARGDLHLMHAGEAQLVRPAQENVS